MGRASFSAGTPDSSFSEEGGTSSFHLHGGKRKASAPVTSRSSYNTSGKLSHLILILLLCPIFILFNTIIILFKDIKVYSRCPNVDHPFSWQSTRKPRRQPPCFSRTWLSSWFSARVSATKSCRLRGVPRLLWWRPDPHETHTLIYRANTHTI